MSFDRATRASLARIVGQARERLKADVVEQLRRLGFQEDGSVLDLDAIAGLTEEEYAAGLELRTLLDHYASLEPAGGRQQVAYDRLAREIGFTTLNRLVALRMAEERGLIVQSVGQGLRSEGFQVYERVANGALGNRAQSYRAYLECLYDELAVDLPLLFDRTDARSRLFPGERCLEDVLGLLNAPDLAELWKEDETIGWVYQYYNDPDERKQMRAAAAPRNSRELAVRNQFFTPRYVVEFLTDNTLGRLWYEMRQGETALTERCRYLVRAPDEVLLGDLSEESPLYEPLDPDWQFLTGASDTLAPFVEAGGQWRGGNVVGETADGRPIHQMPWVDYDEAAFRLAGFASFVRPFDWMHDRREDALEELLHRLNAGEQLDLTAESTQDLWDCMLAIARADRFSEGTLNANLRALTRIANEIRRRLLAARATEPAGEQHTPVPSLVRYRAQKDPRQITVLDPACGSGHFLLYAFDLLETIYAEAYDDPELDTALQQDFPDREQFRRAIPGLILRHNLHGIDIDRRACQIAALSLWLRAQRAYQALGLAPADRPRITRTNVACAEPMPGEKRFLEEYLRDVHERLRPLVRQVWERMQLASEAGSLLKIEEEIAATLAEARSRALVAPRQATFAGMGRPEQLGLPLASESEEQFWASAAEHLLAALEDYASRASDGDGTQHRMFAEDAARGFAFIDLCRQRYDVVLMNPPFGEAARASKAYIERAYPRTKNDVYAAFVERWLGRLYPRGMLGAITSRTGFFLSSFQKWREEVLLKEARPTVMADLGYGVLDSAMVEVAAYVVQADRVAAHKDDRGSASPFV